MKRMPLIIILSLFVLSLASPLAAYGAAISLNVDGIPLKTDVPPQIYHSRVLVPFRAAGEALNAYVEYNPKNKEIVANSNGITVKLQVNSKTALVNGKAVTLDAPPLMSGGRTLIPMRFFGEAFGCTVAWDGATDTVSITSPVKAMEVTAFYALGDSRTSSWTNLFGAAYPQTSTGNTGRVSTVACGWYSLESDGSLITDSSSGWRKPQGWEQVLTTAKQFDLKTEMVVQRTDKGGVLAALLSDEAASAAAIENIALEAKFFDGVNLDFEGLGWNDTNEAQQVVQQNFNHFVKRLSGELAAENIQLTLTLHPLNSDYHGYDYAALGSMAHRIIIMAYDYGPKPEPANLVTEAVVLALDKVPAQKILLGVTAVGETRQSFGSKIGIAKQYNLKGVALWRLGLITPEMWETLGKSVAAK